MQNIIKFNKYLHQPLKQNSQIYVKLKNKKKYNFEVFQSFLRITNRFNKNKIIKEGGKRLKGFYRSSFKNKPLITIVTVVLNNNVDLEKTIKSVVSQKYENIEYIIIDGGSNGSVISTIKKFDNRIDYWISQRDKGIFDAQNKGVMLATGDYICMLNVGDYFTENAIKYIVKKINKRKNLDIIFGSVKKIKIHSGFKKENIKKTLNIFPSHVSTFINMKIYKKYGLYDLRYKNYNDYEFIYRLIKNKKLNFEVTSKNELITVFDLKGFSSKIDLQRRLLQEAKIRVKYENFILVIFKMLIKFIRFYQIKYFYPKKFSKYN